MKIHNGGKRPHKPQKKPRPAGATWALEGQREYCKGVLERQVAAWAEEQATEAHPERPTRDEV